MKIIFKIFLLKKNIIRHFIILILLLSFSFIVLEAKSTLEQKIYDRLNIPDNKTITITLKDNITINDIKEIPYINKVYKEQEEYIIIFNDYTGVDRFKNEYINYYNSIKINSITENDLKLLQSVLFLISVVVIITLIVLVILLIFNLFEVILQEKNELALFKIMGYKNKIILKIFLKALIFSHTIAYLISILLTQTINIIIKIFVNNLISINIRYYLIIYIVLILITIIINILGNIYIKKINLLKFKISNIY